MAKQGYQHGERNQHVGQLTTTWLTPPALIEALGPFDTDVATPTGGMPWRTATRMITEEEDSLSMDWAGFGFTWCNPPWGPEQWDFIERMAYHGNGIALIRNRSNTKAFHRFVWRDDKYISGVFYFSGAKLTFHSEDGTKAAHCDPWPCVLLCYGKRAMRAVRKALLDGRIRGTLTPRSCDVSIID